MNWLLIIIAVLLIWRVAEGIHRGMIKELISFISLAFLCVAAILVWNILTNYMQKDIFKIIVAVLLLLILLIAHKVLGLVFFSAKLVSHLPVIHSADKLLGALIGVLETVLIVWILFTFSDRMGTFGDIIIESAGQYKFTRVLYDHNLLQTLLGNVFKK
ncbi:MAG: CvpA family protein [Lachnospiraceae bacterium]